VEPALAQKCADAGGAVVILPGPGGPGVPLRILPHRPEFVDGEALSEKSYTLLTENYGTGCIQLDRDRDQRHERRADDEKRRGQGSVETSLRDQISLRSAEPVGENQSFCGKPVDPDLSVRALERFDGALDLDPAQLEIHQRFNGNAVLLNVRIRNDHPGN